MKKLTPTRASELAKYIIYKCQQDDHEINNIVLNIIMYNLQCEAIKHGGVLFYDPISCDGVFPMVKNVYYAYCGHGVMPLNDTWLRNNPDIYPNKEFVDPIVDTLVVKPVWDLFRTFEDEDSAFMKTKNSDPPDLIGYFTTF